MDPFTITFLYISCLTLDNTSRFPLHELFQQIAVAERISQKKTLDTMLLQSLYVKLSITDAILRDTFSHTGCGDWWTIYKPVLGIHEELWVSCSHQEIKTIAHPWQKPAKRTKHYTNHRTHRDWLILIKRVPLIWSIYRTNQKRVDRLPLSQHCYSLTEERMQHFHHTRSSKAMW